MSDIGNTIGGIVPPLVGLAVAGYAVKTIGGMMHARCNHCGHTIKSRSHSSLKARAASHRRTVHNQTGSYFF